MKHQENYCLISLTQLNDTYHGYGTNLSDSHQFRKDRNPSYKNDLPRSIWNDSIKIDYFNTNNGYLKKKAS
jgi:hypothetical protein